MTVAFSLTVLEARSDELSTVLCGRGDEAEKRHCRHENGSRRRAHAHTNLEQVLVHPVQGSLAVFFAAQLAILGQLLQGRVHLCFDKEL